ETAQHLVRNRRLSKVHADQLLLGRFNPLANSLRNLFGLAGAIAHHARSSIAHHDQGCERHVLAALHHFRDAVNRHHLVLQVELVGIEFLLYSRHCFSQLSDQAFSYSPSAFSSYCFSRPYQLSTKKLIAES